MTDPLLAFYADDFTGATDALQALSVAGVRAVLFLEPPGEADLDTFDGVDAVGVAGHSRSMTPAEMERALPPAFDALADLDAPLVHYKVCSTFDSSPAVGSIGQAIDLGQVLFDSPIVPLVVGAPPLGRYVVFANHFADYDGETYRLDRHPVMRDHPVTPMDESDLRRHLGKQTDRDVGHVDLHTLEEGVEPAREALRGADGEVVCFDTLTDDHLGTIGDLLWTEAQDRADAEAPLFVVGSSGVEYALADRWERQGVVDGEGDFPDLDLVDRLVVVSGSVSPTTDRQIEWALDAGFAGVRLDAAALVDPETADTARNRAVRDARRALASGDSVVLYSARGPDDPTIDAVNEKLAALDVEGGASERLGVQQGRILRRLLDETGIRRACVAGGDTCSYVAPELDVYALETLSPTAPGSPLCRAHTRGSFDDLQLALKGGQLGQEDYFERVRRGE